MFQMVRGPAVELRFGWLGPKRSILKLLSRTRQAACLSERTGEQGHCCSAASPSRGLRLASPLLPTSFSPRPAPFRPETVQFFDSQPVPSLRSRDWRRHRTLASLFLSGTPKPKGSHLFDFDRGTWSRLWTAKAATSPYIHLAKGLLVWSGPQMKGIRIGSA